MRSLCRSSAKTIKSKPPPCSPRPVDVGACAIQNVSIVTVAPPKPPVRDEPDALIPEARAHQWRRRLIGAAFVALAAGIALSIYAIVSGGASQGPHTGGGGPDAVAASPRCHSAELRLAGPRFNGAYTGHSVDNFTFTNASSHACVLRGWPTVSLVLSNRVVTETTKGAHIRNGAQRTGHLLPVRAVRLSPGGSASFDVVSSSPFMLSHPRCVQAFGELVTPPGGDVPLRVRVSGRGDYWPAKYCGYGVLVTPVVPGRNDDYQAG